MENRVTVISLPTASKRLETFKELNAHLPALNVFPAILGRQLDRTQLIDDGLITEQNIYSPGALGCALSHVRASYR